MKPVKKIALTGAAGQIVYSLAFRIAQGDLFGPHQPIALHLLDVEGTLEGLKGLVMELEDCLFPLLHAVKIGTCAEEIFEEVDVAVLIGAKPRSPGMERKELLKENGAIFVEQGRALNQTASKHVRVLVVGNPCNTNCLIALHQAPNLSPFQFHAMTRLDQNRAVYQLAKKATVLPQEVSRVTIWGNHSATQVPDFTQALIQGRPLAEKIQDRTWLEQTFVQGIQNRGAVVLATRGKSSAASAAQAILHSLQSIFFPTPKHDWFSLGALSTNSPYPIQPDLIFSFPCASQGEGIYTIVPSLIFELFYSAKNRFNRKRTHRRKRSDITSSKEPCMREGVLFEITKDQLDTGLRGFPIGYCTTSHVDPNKGLTYVGGPIADLGFWNPIDVIYLLYFGNVGTRSQVDTFHQDLMQRASVHPETIRQIHALPQKGSAMDLFAATLLLAGVYETTQNYREDCLNVIARLPELVATLINHHAQWGETPPSQPALGYMENFVHMLQIPRLPPSEKQRLIPLLRLFNVLHYDHGGGNLSTFIGKAVASGLEPMYGSLAAAMTALAGPRHGGANQDGLEFTQELLKAVGEEALPSDVETWLREKLARHELIFGFGHAVLRVEDPRAALFYNYAQKEYPHHPLIKVALLLRKVGPKVLEEHSKIMDPHPNIDAITGALLSAAGFPYPAYFPLLFGLSRAVGIAIQIVYERLEARGGKGTPIVRPLYFYKARA